MKRWDLELTFNSSNWRRDPYPDQNPIYIAPYCTVRHLSHAHATVTDRVGRVPYNNVYLVKDKFM